MKKRVLAMLIMAVMLVGVFCGCGDNSESDKEKTVWLPLGLEFGQSYDSFCKTVSEKGYEAPELKDATANNGYLSKAIYEDDTVFEWDFLHSETLINMSKSEDPLTKMKYGFYLASWGFSFNENKELYEMYCMFTVDEDDENIDAIVSEVSKHFDGVFKTKGTDKASGDLLASWENDEMVMSISSYTRDYPANSRIIMIVLHNKEHDTVTKE